MIYPPGSSDLPSGLATLLLSAVDVLNKARANCEGEQVVQACEDHVRSVEVLIAKWSDPI
jgi:hypothetical protein